MLAHSPRAFPWEIEPPVGNHHVKENAVRKARARRPRQRICVSKNADASTTRDVGTSATARTRNACDRSTAGWRLDDRPNVARTTPSKPSMPRQRKRAVSRPSPCPRMFRNRNLRLRVVTQQNLFFPPLCDRPGCYEPPVTSPRNPARYCCAACRQAVRNVLDRERKWLLSRHLGWPDQAVHGIPGRTPAPTAASVQRGRRSATAGTPAMTKPSRCAGRQLSRRPGRLF